MKILTKTLLKYYLKLFTRITLLYRRPIVIAIAGSTNKSFVKYEIKKQLKAMGVPLRANPKSFNTEIGLPLSILNLKSGYNEYKRWLPAILGAPLACFKNDFPKYLVLELGISNPGDMRYLLSLVKPDITIITDITQRYIDSFPGMDRLAKEYEFLAKKTQKKGILVLNMDNYRVISMAEKSPVDTISFGTKDASDWQAINITKTKSGQNLIVKHKDKNEEFFIPRHGLHHVYALLVGLIIKDYVSKHHRQKNDQGK